MTSTNMRVLPDAAGRVQILLVYLLTLGSAVVVFPCGVAMYFLFHTMPKAEQVELPAVMPSHSHSDSHTACPNGTSTNSANTASAGAR